jgi:hypothetical protein
MNVLVHPVSLRGHGRALVVAAAVAGLAAFGAYEGLTGGSGALAVPAEEAAPVTLQPIGKTGLNRVVLSAQAVDRIGIETAPVRGTRQRLVIPYSALIYGPNGQVWTYASPARRTFVRQPVTVADINGDSAVVLNGPRPGARVVTVGAGELFGSEIEFEE